jgi:hypothetical protein
MTRAAKRSGKRFRGLRDAAGLVASLIIVFGLAAGLFALIYPLAPAILGYLHKVLVVAPPPKIAGFVASIVSAVVAFGYAAVTQNRKRRNYVTRYRWVEELLVEKNHLTREDILRYHAEYNWDVYAGISFSTLLVIVSLLFTFGKDARYEAIDYLIVFASMLLLAISAIVLAVVDMFHTNTLSPLVTCKKRFELVDIILKLGSLAIVMQVCAITIFLSLLNSWLSIAVAIVSLLLIVFFSRLRGIPLETLIAEFQLTEVERDEVGNA